MNALTPEQLAAIQQRARLDDRTVAAVAMRQVVSKGTRARFIQAADDLDIKIPRGFFAVADDRKPTSGSHE